jgi:hypothetical protein
MRVNKARRRIGVLSAHSFTTNSIGILCPSALLASLKRVKVDIWNKQGEIIKGRRKGAIMLV